MDNKYIEYSRNISVDLDTIEESEIIKTTIDIKTSKKETKKYSININKEASDYKDSVTNDDYDKEIKDLKEKTKIKEKVEFYQNSFSEWEHDDSNLEKEIKDILTKDRK